MKIEFLRKARLFDNASDAELASLEPHVHMREVDAGVMVIQHLEPDDDVYFILEGQLVALLVSPEGRELAFDVMRPGDTFGEIAALDGRKRSASVIALTKARVANISATAFREAVARIPSVNERLIGLLVSRLRRTSSRIYENATLKVRSRVRLELLRLAAQQGAGDGDTIKSAPTHSQIAALISANREAVTREINALAQEGVISTKRGQITFHKLAELVDGVTPALDYGNETAVSLGPLGSDA